MAIDSVIFHSFFYVYQRVDGVTTEYTSHIDLAGIIL